VLTGAFMLMGPGGGGGEEEIIVVVVVVVSVVVAAAAVAVAAAAVVVVVCVYIQHTRYSISCHILLGTGIGAQEASLNVS
jgi:hypothetical protein